MRDVIITISNAIQQQTNRRSNCCSNEMHSLNFDIVRFWGECRAITFRLRSVNFSFWAQNSLSGPSPSSVRIGRESLIGSVYNEKCCINRFQLPRLGDFTLWSWSQQRIQQPLQYISHHFTVRNCMRRQLYNNAIYAFTLFICIFFFQRVFSWFIYILALYINIYTHAHTV